MAPLLLHISDIHAQAGQPLEDLANAIVAVIKGKFAPEFLIASGDFGFKGKGAGYGAIFVRTLAGGLNIASEKIVCCPGNHDIQSDRSFQEYFEAVAKILEDAGRASPHSCSRYLVDGVEFVVINSAYHLEWKYGKVDTHNLIKELEQLSPGHTRIAVVHHHSIPFGEEDQSEIVNAYAFLSLLAQYEFDALIHGHRHIAMSLKIGSGTKVIGVGSVNYPPEANVNNQFNLIEIGEKVIRFRYYRDSLDRGGTGNWSPIEEPW